MSGETFTPEWLRLREPADHRSRSAELIEPLEEWWRARRAARVLDLGCGTGSNVRYLAPRLPGPQRWTLVDQDARLLSLTPKAGESSLPGVASVETVQGDLAREGLAEVAKADLVTASALLDLVSEGWLGTLVTECARAKCAALFALNWDGGVSWRSRGNPADDADDALVIQGVRTHQLRDKGLGPALGPTAGLVAKRGFEKAGYRTWMAHSPWSFGDGDEELSRQLVAGWENAAVEQLPDMADRIHAWAERRRATVAAGSFTLTVGHVDLLALPAD